MSVKNIKMKSKMNLKKSILQIELVFDDIMEVKDTNVDNTLLDPKS